MVSSLGLVATELRKIGMRTTEGLVTRFSCHRLENVGMRTTEGRVCFVNDLGLVATFAM